MCVYLVFLLYVLPFIFCEIPVLTKYYCVIGAGPAGLQMAYFLHKAERDYVVFEQNDAPGSFFQRYPRHRKLISKNIRDTGSTSKEFNLRHDLNSLISDKDILFTDYSEEIFPSAEELIRYLHDYQKELNLVVQFNTKIGDIKYNKDAKTDHCRYTMRDQDQNLYCCRNIFIATGWQKSKMPNSLKGIEHAEAYETMSTNPEDYKDKTVLIVGRGFSGFETALSLKESAKDVHMAGTSRIQINFGLSGALKGLTNEILGNLDGFFEMDVEEMEFVKLPSGKIQVIANQQTKEKSAQNFLKEGYDRVILCLGFQWDDSIFDSSIKVPSVSKPGVPKDTFPDVGIDCQAKEYPGLFFIGPLSHALDYRKSSGGGFIRGFRHTERALHRVIEWKNHGVRWPSVTKSIDQLLPTLLNRANAGAGIYNSFGHLCDLAIYNKTKKQFTYLEELPTQFLPHLLKNSGYEFHADQDSAFILIFEHEGVEKAEETKDLQPVVYFYRGRLPSVDDMNTRQSTDKMPNPDVVHQIETSLQSENANALISSLSRFLEITTQENLRQLSSETCAAYSLTSKQEDNALPSGCKSYDGKIDSALMYH